MKNKYIMKLMGLMVVFGCLSTYLFIKFHNDKHNNHPFPKKIAYEEVYGPAYERINKLIAEQKQNPSENFVLINNLEQAMLELKITKEIYLHAPKESTRTVPTYPLIILWGAISLLGFALLRVKELQAKSKNNSYEKILDHLEISYSQDHQININNYEGPESVKDFISNSKKEI